MSVTNVTTVTSSEIHTKIARFISRFVVFPMPEHLEIVSLWVLHTHLFEAAHATPYIYLTSAEMGSGKTRVIDVLELLVREPFRTVSVSDAVLYRSMETSPTMMIDEVDTVYGTTGSGKGGNETMRAILNGGYRAGSTVQRMGAGADSEIEAFQTFAPKLMAGIDHGHLPGTILDRSIPIRLRRKLKSQHVERFIRRLIQREADSLKLDIEAWAETHKHELSSIHPAEMIELSDRRWEISEPLVAIAELFGKRFSANTRKALVTIFNSEKEPISEGTKLLTQIREALNGVDKITSVELARRVSIAPKRLASKLRPYEIRSTTIRFDGTPIKGYYARDFEDAFERYL